MRGLIMTYRRLASAVACMGVGASLVAGPVSHASADGLDMLSVLAKYNPVIGVAEERLGVAVAEFKHTGNVRPVEVGISGAIRVDRVVAIKVAHQSAFSALEREAKAKIIVGLAEMVRGSRQIGSAYKLIPINGRGAE